MQISSNGITRLKREEGERLKAYPDSRGIPTIGVGHTGKVDGIFATQGDISTLSGLCRIALWYGVNATRPEAIGVGLPGQTA